MDKRLRHLALLRCFEAAARLQSYSKAALELSVSQAAVSQQIRSLEQHLGVKLFSREGRAMLLTTQGKNLLESVSQAFSLLTAGFDRIQSEPEDGVLTVTASPSFCSRWLVPRLWQFSSLYPNISVRALASARYEDVRHNDIDVAIRQGEMQVNNVHQETLLIDPVFPVCSPAMAKQMKLNSPESICSCWLVEAVNPGHFSWKNWFELAGVTMKPGQLNWIEVTTWEMGINAVLSGHGICLTSACIAGDMLEAGLLVKPFDIQIEPGIRFSLLFDEASPRLARIMAFSNWLKTEISKG
jgi:LysR family transcriptional regulator, glycine cleavage system transcriptional activator